MDDSQAFHVSTLGSGAASIGSIPTFTSHTLSSSVADPFHMYSACTFVTMPVHCDAHLSRDSNLTANHKGLNVVSQPSTIPT